MGATIVQDYIYESMLENADAPIELFHGYTYSAHPVGAAAVCACLSETQRISTKDNAGVRGKQLYEGILKLKKKFDVIGDVRGGQGLMAAIEVVSDQRKKTAMSMDEMKKLHQNTYEAGAMVRLGLNNILMSPPLVISEAEIDQILDALDYGFSSM